jgi:hypothetical protein
MREHTLRQVISLDAVGDRQCLQLRHQAPVPADHALDQSRMPEVVEPAILAVALPGRIHQRQPLGPANAVLVLLARLDVALLKRNRDVLRKADADEARRRHCFAVVNQLHRFARGDDLALLEALEPLQKFAPACHGCPSLGRRAAERTGRCPRPAM